MCQIEIDCLHQLAFRADTFEESDQLQLEENYWVNRWASNIRVILICQSTDKAEIDTLFHLTIEVVLGNQIFQRNGNVLPEVPDLMTKQDSPPWIGESHRFNRCATA
jgi:hypothetical protein